jgi:hypothetical protein
MNMRITEVLMLHDIILNQNYFIHNEILLKQTDSLAMGSPSSAILSEISYNTFESNCFIKLALKDKLLRYFRYVDDILLVYDHNTTNINDFLHDFSGIFPSLHFTVEMERIKLLDIFGFIC